MTHTKHSRILCASWYCLSVNIPSANVTSILLRSVDSGPYIVKDAEESRDLQISHLFVKLLLSKLGAHRLRNSTKVSSERPAKWQPHQDSNGGGRIRKLETAFQKNYQSVQYAFVQFLSEHFTDCSRAFGGDLQEMLVLAIVGQAYLDGLRRKPSEGMGASVTASSIADVCGIPRQTIRRKLLRLDRKNWIEQLTDQSWRLKVDGEISFARQSLIDLDRRGVLRLARLFAKLESNLSDGARRR